MAILPGLRWLPPANLPWKVTAIKAFMPTRGRRPTRVPSEVETKQVIGITPIDEGSGHRYPVGYRLKVIAEIKGAGTRRYDTYGIGTLITDDESLVANGGHDLENRADVLPRITKDRDGSFCSQDPRAMNLAAFAWTGTALGWGHAVDTPAPPGAVPCGASSRPDGVPH